MKPATLCLTSLTTLLETTMNKDDLAYFQMEGRYYELDSKERYSYEENKSDTYDDPDWVDS